MRNPILSGTSGSTLKVKNRERIQKKIQNFKLNEPAEARDFFTTKDEFVLGPTTLQAILEDHDKAELINLIDVRKMEDFNKGHLPWATNVPADQWQEASKYLSKTKVNVIYCYSLDCPLAGEAAKIFAEQGYPVMELLGGFDGWHEVGFKVEKMAHH